MTDFVILLLGAVACVSIGIGIGYKLSHDAYGRKCDDGLIVWRYEEDDGECGWDGTDEALDDIEAWINGRP